MPAKHLQFAVAFCPLVISALVQSAIAAENTVTYQELEAYSATEHKLHPDSPTLLGSVTKKFGKHATYPVSQVNSIEASSPAETPEDAKYTPPAAVKPRPAEGWAVVTHALLHPKLRHDYTDVLPAEDPSQQDLSAGKFDDLTGASFSYAWDGKAHTDTWSAQAALIAPMIWSGNLEYGIKPIYYGIVPSVSLNRITTNGDPENEVDSLTYRAGVFAQWLVAGHPGQSFHARLNFRGSFTYTTDTKNDLELPAGEFDLEPQIFGGPGASLGYVGEIFYDPRRAYDDPKRITLGYQLRAWLHGEYGSIQRESIQVPGQHDDDDFFRLGPIVQLRVLLPKVFEGLTLSAEYHYLPTLSGVGGHDSLFKAGAELTIVDHAKDSGPRISLTANYIEGGLDLTKEDVKTFTLGLGVLF